MHTFVVQIDIHYFKIRMEKLQLLETKYVKIGGITYPVRLSFRALIEYEQQTGQKVKDISGTENLCKLFYYAVKAGARETYMKFELDYDDFLQRIDKHPQSFVEFMNILYEIDDDEEDGEKKNQSLFQILTLEPFTVQPSR